MCDYTAISLFCGAGGLDMGFSRAGFATIWANDNNKDACDTFGKWSDAEVSCKNISEIEAGFIPNADIMLGGFPCQGFSISGPRNIDDTRNILYKEYVRIVDGKKPKAFIGENVKGILTMGDGRVFAMVVNDFAKCGYNIYHALLNAKDYGVPQNRERIFIVGIRKDIDDKAFTFPEKTSLVTLKEAIGGMEKPEKEDICDAPYSSRYMSRNRKKNWDDVSFTIPAMAKQVPLHPSSPDMIKKGKDLWEFGEGDTRRLSWQECAAIQTFPCDMEFCGNLTSKYKQVGNAVPVKLAEEVASQVKKIL